MTKQRKGRRTRVTLNCVADHYAAPGERIVEFMDAETGKGGLISFTRTDAGELVVNLYRLDAGVIVRVGEAGK